MLGRDSRTLSKLFEEVIKASDEYERMLLEVREAVDTPQRKFIEGLRY